jgi:flagellar biosynthesis GTPase FlhF
MAAPERLNVLLSRARKAIILVGNSETFLASRKGQSTWTPFFNLLRQGNNIHDGLPVKCEQHPDRQNELKQPSDFDKLAPNGGCSEPCGKKLSCGLHDCPQRCHKLADHSKMPCTVQLSDKCPEKHKITWQCSKARPASCSVCDAEARALAKRQKRDAELDLARQQKQEAYANRLAEIQDKIDRSLRERQEQDEDEERENALRQRQKDLQDTRRISERIKKQREARQTAAMSKAPEDAAVTEKPVDANGKATGERKSTTEAEDASSEPLSSAQEDWEHQKQFEDASNEQLDELMTMIGLENVKEAFLDIKAKIDLTVRQNTSLAKERFGVSLLGNPGTGKTTVARLYGKFLTSVGALPGDDFVETTGAKLANEGVQGCKKILDDIKKSGGGALFIDEAYQLTSGSSFGGGAVLDFLLAESRT